MSHNRKLIKLCHTYPWDVIQLLWWCFWRIFDKMGQWLQYNDELKNSIYTFIVSRQRKMTQRKYTTLSVTSWEVKLWLIFIFCFVFSCIFNFSTMTMDFYFNYKERLKYKYDSGSQSEQNSKQHYLQKIDLTKIFPLCVCYM